MKLQVTVNKPFNQIEEANMIRNTPQPDSSHSLSLLSRILSLVSAMAEPMVLLVGNKTIIVREICERGVWNVRREEMQRLMERERGR